MMKRIASVARGLSRLAGSVKAAAPERPRRHATGRLHE